jgi:hypothetical protein
MRALCLLISNKNNHQKIVNLNHAKDKERNNANIH